MNLTDWNFLLWFVYDPRKFLPGTLLIPRAMTHSVTNAVTLSCHSSYMSVQVNLKYFNRWLDPGSLHLRHHSCGSNHYNNTSVSFLVPLYGCGTRRRSHEKSLIYTNAITNSNRNSSFISRVPYVRIPFHCVYRRRYSFILATGKARKRHIAKKTRKPHKEGILLSEKTAEADNPGDSGTDSLHISRRILWLVTLGLMNLVIN